MGLVVAHRQSLRPNELVRVVLYSYDNPAVYPTYATTLNHLSGS